MYAKPFPGDYERLCVRQLNEGLPAEELEKAIEKSKENAFIQWLIKEGIYKDEAQALGGIHDVVVDAAVPALVGRELVSIVPTSKDPTRFIRAAKGKAWETGEAPSWITPETYGSVDVSAIELKSGAKWSQTFLEDAEWNAEQRLVAECGRAVGELETSKIDAVLAAITATDLAGGGELTISSPITWAEFEQMITRVENEDFRPKVFACTPTVYGELFRLDQFIRSVYYAPERAIRTGVVETTLGVKVVKSTLISQSYAIDTDFVAMTVRRELNTIPFEDPAEMKYGALANERVGIHADGVLRTKAVARGSR